MTDRYTIPQAKEVLEVCARVNCGKPAAVKPRLMVSTDGEEFSEVAFMDLPVCASCQETLVVDARRSTSPRNRASLRSS